ncbi:hypothetical protein EYF80_048382 [Liparis tanakae]|uniref:Uncharacterized protein n=1 Tax=Liparis tanakae TaxID=230148 RepID=A0A4Z2FJX8_9TELE|nr:hypothetical protein EYF80_048382 [Liparis tanakae]
MDGFRKRPRPRCGTPHGVFSGRLENDTFGPSTSNHLLGVLVTAAVKVPGEFTDYTFQPCEEQERNLFRSYVLMALVHQGAPKAA